MKAPYHLIQGYLVFFFFFGTEHDFLYIIQKLELNKKEIVLPLSTRQERQNTTSKLQKNNNSRSEIWAYYFLIQSQMRYPLRH